MHALRTTHRSWAEAAGVHPLLIDKQVGHLTPGGSAAVEVARTLLATSTGRRFYVDMKLKKISAHESESAKAVRQVLNSALPPRQRTAKPRRA